MTKGRAKDQTRRFKPRPISRMVRASLGDTAPLRQNLLRSPCEPATAAQPALHDGHLHGPNRRHRLLKL